MFAHLNPQSSDVWDICALYSPFLHQLTMCVVHASYGLVQAKVGVGTVAVTGGSACPERVLCVSAAYCKGCAVPCKAPPPLQTARAPALPKGPCPSSRPPRIARPDQSSCDCVPPNTFVCVPQTLSRCTPRTYPQRVLCVIRCVPQGPWCPHPCTGPRSVGGCQGPPPPPKSPPRCSPGHRHHHRPQP